MPESSTPNRSTVPQKKLMFLPREHGATSMLFTPIVCAAILARGWRWAELATLTAAFAALAAKDPLVVLARQRFVWKQPHPETVIAARWFAGWIVLLGLSGLVLLATWPLKATLALGVGVAAFSALAIAVNVKNRQRSTLFQIASAVALTSSSGHVDFGYRDRPAMVLVAMAPYGIAGHDRHLGCTCTSRCAHCYAFRKS